MPVRRFIIGTCLVTIGLLGPASAQELAIDVAFVEIQDEASPRTAVHRVPMSLNFRLASSNALSESTRADHGTSGMRTGSREVRPGETYASGIAKVRWRVGGQNVLVRETDFPGFIRRVTVRIVGKAACSATVGYHLKRGARQYEMRRVSNREPVFMRALRAEGITCRIIGA
jgi:hypothetical protein